jgi:hypothetical protein
MKRVNLKKKNFVVENTSLWSRVKAMILQEEPMVEMIDKKMRVSEKQA